MVRQRSAKPLFIGSIPIAASNIPNTSNGLDRPAVANPEAIVTGVAEIVASFSPSSRINDAFLSNADEFLSFMSSAGSVPCERSDRRLGRGAWRLRGDGPRKMWGSHLLRRE